MGCEVLKYGIGSLTQSNEELFSLPTKVSKREIKYYEGFLNIYFERSRVNPYIKDVQGRHFW